MCPEDLMTTKKIASVRIQIERNMRPLGHPFLTFGADFHMYTCMHAFARLIASHPTVKVHDVDVTAKHYVLIDQRHAPE